MASTASSSSAEIHSVRYRAGLHNRYASVAKDSCASYAVNRNTLASPFERQRIRNRLRVGFVAAPISKPSTRGSEATELPVEDATVAEETTSGWATGQHFNRHS